MIYDLALKMLICVGVGLAALALYLCWWLREGPWNGWDRYDTMRKKAEANAFLCLVLMILLVVAWVSACCVYFG